MYINLERERERVVQEQVLQLEIQVLIFYDKVPI